MPITAMHHVITVCKIVQPAQIKLNALPATFPSLSIALLNAF